ncbi:hypothetical protein HPB49_013512 [Dermacentor silvarum]|uniref:Uncharacterized protein n=1 Tax=Dermacentor silvarum TaxID=543639 RepID=A0ACB8DJ85_DERSI|nr:hypothetical protein HPB49_013512 [Dermacentor silvarum]
MAPIHHHLDTVSDDDTALASILKKAFCVDDMLVGADTFEEGLDTYERSKTIMNDAGMNLGTHSSEYETRCTQATTDDMTKKWIYRQKLLDHLWIRRRKEYLLELHSLHHYPSCASRDLSRCIWPLGHIAEVYPGQDGVVQACRIKTQNGKFVWRVAHKLYKLELAHNSSGREDVEKE